MSKYVIIAVDKYQDEKVIDTIYNYTDEKGYEKLEAFKKKEADSKAEDKKNHCFHNTERFYIEEWTDKGAIMECRRFRVFKDYKTGEFYQVEY